MNNKTWRMSETLDSRVKQKQNAACRKWKHFEFVFLSSAMTHFFYVAIFDFFFVLVTEEWRFHVGHEKYEDN